MKFQQAYEIALSECEWIKAATERVKAAILSGDRSPCYLFAIGNEVFYFGFDGCEIVKGKHTAKRSAQLINSGDVWRVRN